MQIRKKLIIACIIPTLIVGAISLIGFLLSKALFVEAVDVSAMKIRNALIINILTNEMSRYTKDHIMLGDPAIRKFFDAAKIKQQDQIAAFKKLPLTNQEKQYFATVEQNIQINDELQNKIFNTGDQIAANIQLEQQMLNSEIIPIFAKWQEALQIENKDNLEKKEILHGIETNIIMLISISKYLDQLIDDQESNKQLASYISKIEPQFNNLSKLNLNAQEVLWLNTIHASINKLIETINTNIKSRNTLNTLLAQESAISAKTDDLLDNKLYAIAYTRDQEIEHTIMQMNWAFIITVTLFIIFGFILSSIVAKYLLRPIDYLKNSISRLRSGEAVEVKRTSNDEIGDLSDAFGELVKENKEHSSKLSSQAWLKEHVAEILKTAQAESSLENMSNIVTSKIAELLNAGCGAFYITREDENKVQTLHLLGTYGYKKRKNISNVFKFGESLVGQAALEGNPIVLSDVPEDYIHVTSGLGAKQPRFIILLPIKLENKSLGVMEFALFQQATDIQQQFLEQLCNNLAVVIEAIQNRQQAELALKQVQESSEELQTQQEELRATNEELEEKTHVLQKSEEELKSQSEEMQASNEELEEKMHAIEQQKQEIQAKNSELEAIKAELELKAIDLARAGKYKTEFLANMSHELRTPLNSLLLLSNSFAKNEDGNLTPQQIEEANIIHKGGKDLLSLINDILDLSKVEAGKLNVQITETKINEILKDLDTQFNAQVTAKGLKFIIESSAQVDKINTDAHRLIQVLRNLISNALKFTKSGYIKILVTQSGGDLKLPATSIKDTDYIVFQVIDTGIGIEKEKFKDIFEAFQQAYGDTDRTYGGTGLGLTISRELTKLLGGEILLESKIGQGSTFSVILPIDIQARSKNVVEFVAPSSNEATNSKISITDDRAHIKHGDKVILHIEKDKEFIAKLMQMSNKKGYKTLAALDGTAGLALAREFKPDGVILDLSVNDNLSIIEQLKSDNNTKNIPIHVIANGDEKTVPTNLRSVHLFKKSELALRLDDVFEFLDSNDNKSVALPILLIEDDLVTQNAICKAANAADINIVKVGNAKDGLARLQSEKFSAIILDLILPDMDGLDLLKVANEKSINLPPIVIYSDKDLSEDEFAMINQYTNKIITKDGDSSLERLLNECLLFLHSVNKNNINKNENLKLIVDTDNTLRDKNVLLVDDDMRNVYALSSVLKRHGMKVTIATNGEEALKKMDEMPILDIVIMDIMMPVLDGYETTRRIRKKEKYRNLPIVAVTAKAMPDDKKACLNAGANEYITKPIDADKLLAMLRIWLSTSSRNL